MGFLPDLSCGFLLSLCARPSYSGLIFVFFQFNHLFKYRLFALHHAPSYGSNFGSTQDIDYDICLSAFGISSEEVNAQIANTRSIYGGEQLKASRVMYPNGQIDPWSALGVLTTPSGSTEQPTLWVEGASHHFWTHPSKPTDSDFVVQARQDIWNQVSDWLKE